MIKYFFKKEYVFAITLFHLLLGILSIYNKIFIIVWFYTIILSSFNEVLSLAFQKKASLRTLQLIVYLGGFDVLSRMAKASPFIPWEVSKYLYTVLAVLMLISGQVKYPRIIGLFLLFVLIPGFIIDQSGVVTLERIIANLLGPISMCCLIICISNFKLKLFEFNNLIHLIWYATIPVLSYTMIKTPDYNLLSYSLSASFETTGGFGSNQVSTILGVGMFISYYAWMNRLLFSGYHNLDGLFIGLFAFQGFLSFSRGGMFIGTTALLIYFILFRLSGSFYKYINMQSIRPLMFFLSALFLLIISYSSIQYLSKGNLTKRYLGETESTLSGDRKKSLNTITTGRYNILLTDLNLWAKNPVFGVGAGASPYLRGNQLVGVAPHTEISRLLAEHGLFGLLFICGLAYIGIKIFSRFRSMFGAILFCLYFIGIGTAMHSAMRTYVTPLFIPLSMVMIKNEE